MESRRERRRCPRTDLSPPRIGIVYFRNDVSEYHTIVESPHGTHFIDVLNTSQDGALLRSSQRFDPETVIHLEIYNPAAKSWDLFPAQIIWAQPAHDKAGNIIIGAAFQKNVQALKPSRPDAGAAKQKPSTADYVFFRKVKLLRLLSREAVCPILNSIFHKALKAGERLIHQGASGDAFYVIQKGRCSVNIDKDGEVHRLALRSEYDVIGEMAIITGEPRSANVDAETDMEVWGLSIENFDRISKQYPELRSFMTEIVAERFASSSLTAERKIGKYLITDIVGRGGYSIVYKGFHTVLNMPVAIKMLNHDMAMDPDFWKSFKKEARTIAKFNHENIIRVFDIEENFRTIFIIMEHMRGEPLGDMIRRMGAIPSPLTVDFLIQICSGLEYAHQRGIIHRDIKPDNIIIKPDGRLKLLDFGLACPIGSEDLLFESTLFYLSPEQIEGEALDQRADLYALGIVAYEMVTGKRPYPEDDLIALRNLHLEQDIPDPADIAKDLPGDLRRFIITCCQRNRDQRYQSISQAMEDLKPLGKALRPIQGDLSAQNQRLATFVLIYNEDHQLELNRMMEGFSDQVRELGVVFKSTDFEDI